VRTLRGRLVFGYGIALAATIFTFASAVYIIQRPTQYAQIDPRIETEADMIADIVSEAYQRVGFVVVDASTTLPLGEPRPQLDERVAALLESLSDFVVIVGPQANILYTSDPTRQVASFTQLERMAALAGTAEDRLQYGVVDAGPPIGDLRYVVRTIENAGPRVAGIFAGAHAVSTLEPQRLLIGLLVSGPIVLVASLLMGYAIAGRNIKPVDSIIDEIEAITDGRSLHRRVVQITHTAELARLSTTLNEMLVRLEKNFLSLRRFTADASHELKTPLTVLRAGVERAITHPSATPEVMESLEETLIEINRMTEVVESLLTLARVDEGRAPLHLEELDLREVLSEMAETANILGEDAGVDIEVTTPDSPVYLSVDRGRVRQLLMNLLTNAIKYTNTGGLVTMVCEMKEDAVVIEVSDTGIGIAVADLPYVFDRFWRADAARSRTGRRPGTGLGLAICKWIAEAHGGTIEVKSKRNKGTSFTVSLPK